MPKTEKCQRCSSADASNVRNQAAGGPAVTYRVTCPGCKRRVFGCCTTDGTTRKGNRCTDCAAVA